MPDAPKPVGTHPKFSGTLIMMETTFPLMEEMKELMLVITTPL
jgi:hypothetical protein